MSYKNTLTNIIYSTMFLMSSQSFCGLVSRAASSLESFASNYTEPIAAHIENVSGLSNRNSSVVVDTPTTNLTDQEIADSIQKTGQAPTSYTQQEWRWMDDEVKAKIAEENPSAVPPSERTEEEIELLVKKAEAVGQILYQIIKQPSFIANVNNPVDLEKDGSTGFLVAANRPGSYGINKLSDEFFALAIIQSNIMRYLQFFERLQSSDIVNSEFYLTQTDFLKQILQELGYAYHPSMFGVLPENIVQTDITGEFNAINSSSGQGSRTLLPDSVNLPALQDLYRAVSSASFDSEMVQAGKDLADYTNVAFMLVSKPEILYRLLLDKNTLGNEKAALVMSLKKQGLDTSRIKRLVDSLSTIDLWLLIGVQPMLLSLKNNEYISLIRTVKRVASSLVLLPINDRLALVQREADPVLQNLLSSLPFVQKNLLIYAAMGEGSGRFLDVAESSPALETLEQSIMRLANVKNVEELSSNPDIIAIDGQLNPNSSILAHMRETNQELLNEPQKLLEASKKLLDFNLIRKEKEVIRQEAQLIRSVQKYESIVQSVNGRAIKKLSELFKENLASGKFRHLKTINFKKAALALGVTAYIVNLDWNILFEHQKNLSVDESLINIDLMYVMIKFLSSPLAQVQGDRAELFKNFCYVAAADIVAKTVQSEENLDEGFILAHILQACQFDNPVLDKTLDTVSRMLEQNRNAVRVIANLTDSAQYDEKIALLSSNLDNAEQFLKVYKGLLLEMSLDLKAKKADVAPSSVEYEKYNQALVLIDKALFNPDSYAQAVILNALPQPVQDTKGRVGRYARTLQSYIKNWWNSLSSGQTDDSSESTTQQTQDVVDMIESAALRDINAVVQKTPFTLLTDKQADEVLKIIQASTTMLYTLSNYAQPYIDLNVTEILANGLDDVVDIARNFLQTASAKNAIDRLATQLYQQHRVQLVEYMDKNPKATTAMISEFLYATTGQYYLPEVVRAIFDQLKKRSPMVDQSIGVNQADNVVTPSMAYRQSVKPPKGTVRKSNKSLNR